MGGPHVLLLSPVHFVHLVRSHSNHIKAICRRYKLGGLSVYISKGRMQHIPLSGVWCPSLAPGEEVGTEREREIHPRSLPACNVLAAPVTGERHWSEVVLCLCRKLCVSAFDFRNSWLALAVLCISLQHLLATTIQRSSESLYSKHHSIKIISKKGSCAYAA